MFGNGVLVEDLCSGEGVFDLVMVEEVVVGKQFASEGEEEVVRFGYDLVGEVKIARVVETDF